MKRSAGIFWIFILVVFSAFIWGCAPPTSVGSRQGYEEWLATCKDSRDVAKWQDRFLVYDTERLKDNIHRLSQIRHREIRPLGQFGRK